MRAILIAYMLLILGSLAPAYSTIEPGSEPDCITDSECQAYCPPPADDPDCDGGPQEATDGRGNYGTQP